MKCILIFTILIIAVIAMAVAKKDTCSPWLGKCVTGDDCCRYLNCRFYKARCEEVRSVLVPGEDKRPLGPGPYPPNVPKEWLIP